jgi:sugar phosphate isomerase/epimerase
MPDASRFGLSTAWNGPRFTRMVEVLDEISALGFGRVELYAHFTPEQLERVDALARERGLEISSLHSPCPVLVGTDGQRLTLGDWLASTDEDRRLLAVDSIRRTIDAAARVGARAVVVHLGRVEVESLQEQLFKIIQAHGFGSREHLELLDHARAERARVQPPHLEAALKSARALAEHARGTSVRIGMECRARYFQIPSLDEFAEVFNACEGLPVGYWHDAGHAHRLDGAGFFRHVELLERYGDRLIGMHLHDARGDLDHLAPGQGDIDFKLLAPYAREGVIQTLELSQTVQREDILPGVAVLEAAGLGARPPGGVAKREQEEHALPTRMG